MWGSTYLAIRIGVATFPPALFAGIRFSTAGVLLLALARAMGRPFVLDRGTALRQAGIGILLLCTGNGVVVWAEQFTPSGVAAIFLVTVPLWLATFDALIPGSPARPTLAQAGGLVTGFLGTMLLVGAEPGALRAADWRGPIALTVASISWALGSVFAQRTSRSAALEVGAAVQMLAAGGALLLVGMVTGEARALRLTPAATGALAYLIIFGSLLGYSCYVYVLRHLPAAVVGTSVYINTTVAVLLGWLVLDETVNGRTVLAMSVVLASVAWVRRAASYRSGSSMSSNRIQAR